MTAAVADKPVVVVGGGVAGLHCAMQLASKGVPVNLLEASEELGGRVKTEEVDGFLLDYGFQIFLTSYPEARSALDYEDLDLQPFYSGADVQFGGRFHRVADPMRHLVDSLGTLPNPIGSPVDKLRVGLFRLKSTLGTLDDILTARETTTAQKLMVGGKGGRGACLFLDDT